MFIPWDLVLALKEAHDSGHHGDDPSRYWREVMHCEGCWAEAYERSGGRPLS
jgi:hypothetical protein